MRPQRKKTKKDTSSVPRLSKKQKELYKKSGKWPVPAGIIILNDEEPSKESVLTQLESLAKIVRPVQRKIIESLANSEKGKEDEE